MIDLCLRLSVSVSDLANMTFRRFQLPESDDYVSFQRDGQNVVVSCSYAEGTAAVLYDDLRAAVREFVDGCLERIAREYPLALRNPAMVDVYSRLGRPFREPGGPQTSSVVN